MPTRLSAFLSLALFCETSAYGQTVPASRPTTSSGVDALVDGSFRWRAGPPLIAPASIPDDPCVSVKDPSIVRYDGRWHVFCTIRSQKRTHQIEYLSFIDFEHTATARRTILKCFDGFYCAPQVFFFSPQKRWYLIYQAVLDANQGMVPVYSTSTQIADPSSWSRPVALIDPKPKDLNWIDFWVICDDTHAYLFFTAFDGQLWRSRTALDQFPAGWSKPQVALHADIFEAAHVYRLKSVSRYLALIEAQNGGRRYYKAFVAGKLDGDWQALAASKEKAFASPLNVTDIGEHWTDSFSHGELIRTGHDEKLEVDPKNLRFLFQGVSDPQMAGKPYGQIPWRLGLLESR